MRFSYAVQIQPRNGQALTEYRGGIEDAGEGFREWTEADRKRFPQADRQVGPGFRLVVDRKSTLVFMVGHDEAAGHDPLLAAVRELLSESKRAILALERLGELYPREDMVGVKGHLQAAINKVEGYV